MAIAMYKLRPLKVYALDRVADDRNALARMERMLAGLGLSLGDVQEINDQNLPEMAYELATSWPPEKPPEGVPLTWTRPLVFTMQYLDGEFPSVAEIVEKCPEGVGEDLIRAILGHIEPVRAYHRREDDWQENRVCWPTHDFGTMYGCPHGCQYCGYGKSGKFISIAVNLEEFMEKAVRPTVEKYPWQRCFRMIGWGADHPTLEPEYGCFDLYTSTLAEYEGRYGYFHTASDNLSWVADLPRRDRLIGIWSLAADEVARIIEPGSPSGRQRIDAARFCQDHGVPVRFKLKPIVPIRGWREDYAAVLEYMLSQTEPESIGFCVIMWMTLDRLARLIDLDLLDPEFVQAARDAQEEMKDSVVGPFPHHVRAEIYRFLIREVRRHNKTVRLYISTESREMWDELAEELGQDPRTYHCGCGPVALPGGRLALSPDCPHSTYTLPASATQR